MNSMRIAVGTLVLALVVLGPTTAQGELIGYWKLDDQALSTASATVGPNGTYENFVGTDLGQAASPGDPAGSSVLFRAAGSPYQGINLGANGGIVSGQGALTMSMWVKLDSDALDGDSTFASIGVFGGGAPLIFWRDEDDTTSSRGDTIAVLIGPDRTAGADGALNDTEWHHVAFTYEGNTTDGLKLYIDGEQTGPADSVGGSAVPGSSDALKLGIPSSSPAAEKQFDGLMDEVAIWGNALDDIALRALANGASPESIPEPVTMLLASLGLGGLGLYARRRRAG